MRSSAFTIAFNSWITAFGFVTKMPRLSLTALPLLFIIDQFSTSSLTANSMLYWPLLIISSLLKAVVFTVIAIAIHRSILLEDWLDHYIWQTNSNYKPYFIWVMGFILSWIIIDPASQLFSNSWLIRFCLQITLLLINIRTVLLFPALAINADGSTWQNAWKDSLKSSWRVLLSILITILPLAMFIGFVSLLFYNPAYNDPTLLHSMAPGKRIFLSLAVHAFGIPIYLSCISIIFKQEADLLISPLLSKPNNFMSWIGHSFACSFFLMIMLVTVAELILPDMSRYQSQDQHFSKNISFPVQVIPPNAHPKPITVSNVKRYWVLIVNNSLPDGTLASPTNGPINAVISGYENSIPMTICRVYYSGDILSGKTVSGNCNVPYRGSELIFSTYSVATALGHWNQGSPEGALTAGLNAHGKIYVCRAAYFPLRTSIISHHFNRETVGDHGMHAGMLANDGRCHFSYKKHEYSSKNFELFYPDILPVNTNPSTTSTGSIKQPDHIL